MSETIIMWALLSASFGIANAVLSMVHFTIGNMKTALFSLSVSLFCFYAFYVQIASL